MLDLGETLHKASIGMRPFPEGYWIWWGILIAISTACLLTRNLKVIAGGGVVWLTLNLFFSVSALGELCDIFAG